MFKSIIISTAVPINTIMCSQACVQCVQFHRKPQWMPQAKSKIFRVPERKKQNEDEKADLMRLHNNYKTQVRAVRSYLFEEVKLNQAISSADHVVVTPEEEAADMQRCIEWNAKWNASIAEIRNQRLEKEMKEREEYILSRLELKQQREEEARLVAEERVRLEKERSKTFILREHLDAAIEHALANPVDYNFAITLEGEILSGRTSTDKIEDKVVDKSTATNN